MDYWKNDTFEGIYYSRFIASWIKMGGSKNIWDFRDWLEQLVINGKHLDEHTIEVILNLFDNGKMELEFNAKLFIKAHNIAK